MPSFEVYYRVECSGCRIVEATTKEEAAKIHFALSENADELTSGGEPYDAIVYPIGVEVAPPRVKRG